MVNDMFHNFKKASERKNAIFLQISCKKDNNEIHMTYLCNKKHSFFFTKNKLKLVHTKNSMHKYIQHMKHGIKIGNKNQIQNYSLLCENKGSRSL